MVAHKIIYCEREMKHKAHEISENNIFHLHQHCNDISLITLGVVATKIVPLNKQKEIFILLHLGKCMYVYVLMFGT